MINIISKSYYSRLASGPKKVVENLVKGLDQLGYPYVINHRLDACRQLWIHDDLEALKQINTLDPKVKVVAGPNLVVLPRQLPSGIDLSKAVYLHPSKWAVDFWTDFGFKVCPVVAWPTGIDTSEFVPSQENKTSVLVYFKQRSAEELQAVENALQRKGTAYRVLKYGNYREKEFKSLLAKTRYVVWLGRQESQGIALQEVMAMDIPILVCDVTSVGHWQASPKEMAVFNERENTYAKATSAAYFDDRCGIKIKDLAQLPEALDRMEQNLSDFRPREYILDNLSLQKQARQFLEIYEKYFGLSLEEGKREKVLRSGIWQNRTVIMRTKFLVKDLAKQAMNFRHRCF